MEAFGKFIFVAISRLPAIYITLTGIDHIIVYFHGEGLGLMRTYFLLMAFSFLMAKSSDLNKDNSPYDLPIKEGLSVTITFTIMDAIATYLILPWVLPL